MNEGFDNLQSLSNSFLEKPKLAMVYETDELIELIHKAVKKELDPITMKVQQLQKQLKKQQQFTRELLDTAEKTANQLKQKQLFAQLRQKYQTFLEDNQQEPRKGHPQEIQYPAQIQEPNEGQPQEQPNQEQPQNPPAEEKKEQRQRSRDKEKKKKVQESHIGIVEQRDLGQYKKVADEYMKQIKAYKESRRSDKSLPYPKHDFDRSKLNPVGDRHYIKQYFAQLLQENKIDIEAIVQITQLSPQTVQRWSKQFYG